MERRLEDFVEVKNTFAMLVEEPKEAVEEEAAITTCSTSISTLPTKASCSTVAPTRRKQKNRSARKAAAVKKTMDTMWRAQVARGINDDTYVAVEDTIEEDAAAMLAH